ncbi:hypothetical protein [Cyclobacterium marinum]|uniref:XRE family transcriptional regulator n=1 Tax=Cyclobacterium marinum (strain ATCC 25205 / DSM 745 / LMG 13164 / NCIMB 1802) TaxID=880070 RepID=G0J3C3_CYCMS|nr:hypothetical protein [Cyclobacterium marinum]AEL24064.1 hypothetical protein Cycma_0283 [Cyclobacterium marinum DSM 745]
MIKVKQIFQEKGIEDPRPTSEALKLMRMSRRRFTQLTEGTNKSELRISELVAIRKWIETIKEIDPNELIVDSEKH